MHVSEQTGLRFIEAVTRVGYENHYQAERLRVVDIEDASPSTLYRPPALSRPG